MNQLNKKITFPIIPGSVSERLANTLEDERKGGGINRAMHGWLLAGYQLQELGGGVVETWLALEKNGEMDGMNKTQKARVLCGLLERMETMAYPIRLKKDKPASSVSTSPKKTPPISLDDIPGDTLADL